MTCPGMTRRRWAPAFLLLTAMPALILAAGGQSGAPSLIEAVKRSDTGAARTLIQQQRVDVNAAQADGTTALHWAANHDDAAMAQLLLAAGARVDVRNRYGVTPLLLACESGRGAVVDLLLKAGANVNDALPEGETAAMRAARSGNVSAIKSL